MQMQNMHLRVTQIQNFAWPRHADAKKLNAGVMQMGRIASPRHANANEYVAAFCMLFMYVSLYLVINIIFSPPANS